MSLYTFLVGTALAADPVVAPITGGSAKPTEVISNAFSAIADIVALVAGVLATIYLIWSGIQYITSAGNPEKAKAARTGIINAVIGIVIVVATYGIIRLAVNIGTQINSSVK